MTGAMADKRVILGLVGAVLVAGFALRLWHIAAEPLWLDEAYSAYAAGHGFGFLWHVVPRYETHPPFYYSLLRVWTLAFGDSLTALRALGVLAGLATVPVIAWGADEAARLIGWGEPQRQRARLAAFALASVAIPLVEMARQVAWAMLKGGPNRGRHFADLAKHIVHAFRTRSPLVRELR